MFGLSKNERAVALAEEAIETLLAGLKNIPKQAFADAYVAAFIQTLVLHSTCVQFAGRMPEPVAVAAIMAKALDRFVPGHGISVVKGLAEVGEPTHPFYGNFYIGRQEGNEYIKALATRDSERGREMIWLFRQFLARNYACTPSLL